MNIEKVKKQIAKIPPQFKVPILGCSGCIILLILCTICGSILSFISPQSNPAISQNPTTKITSTPSSPPTISATNTPSPTEVKKETEFKVISEKIVIGESEQYTFDYKEFKGSPIKPEKVERTITNYNNETIEVSRNVGVDIEVNYENLDLDTSWSLFSSNSEFLVHADCVNGGDSTSQLRLGKINPYKITNTQARAYFTPFVSCNFDEGTVTLIMKLKTKDKKEFRREWKFHGNWVLNQN